MIIKNSILLCVFAAMFVLLLYSGERIYLWILLMLTAVLLFCLIYFFYVILALKITQRIVPELAHKSDEKKFIISCKNRGIFPMAYLKLHFTLPLSPYTGEIFTRTLSILPFKTETLEITLDCPYRGTYRFGLEELDIRDMLGFFTLRILPVRFCAEDECEITILPKIRRVKTADAADTDNEGLLEKPGRVSGEPASVADIRPWIPGDSLGAIHWKLSVRRGEFLVRDYNETTTPETYFFINTAFCKGYELNGLILEDRLVEYAVSYINAALKANKPLRCIFYTERRVSLYGDSPIHFPEFFTQLARLDFNSEFPLAGILENELSGQSTAHSIVAVTPPPDGDLQDKLLRLKKAGHNITVVIAPVSGKDDELTEPVRELRDAGVRCGILPDSVKDWGDFF